MGFVGDIIKGVVGAGESVVKPVVRGAQKVGKGYLNDPVSALPLVAAPFVGPAALALEIPSLAISGGLAAASQAFKEDGLFRRSGDEDYIESLAGRGGGSSGYFGSGYGGDNLQDLPANQYDREESQFDLTGRRGLSPSGQLAGLFEQASGGPFQGLSPADAAAIAPIVQAAQREAERGFTPQVATETIRDPFVPPGSTAPVSFREAQDVGIDNTLPTPTQVAGTEEDPFDTGQGVGMPQSNTLEGIGGVLQNLGGGIGNILGGGLDFVGGLLGNPDVLEAILGGADIAGGVISREEILREVQKLREISEHPGFGMDAAGESFERALGGQINPAITPELQAREQRRLKTIVDNPALGLDAAANAFGRLDSGDVISPQYQKLLNQALGSLEGANVDFSGALGDIGRMVSRGQGQIRGMIGQGQRLLTRAADHPGLGMDAAAEAYEHLLSGDVVPEGWSEYMGYKNRDAMRRAAAQGKPRGQSVVEQTARMYPEFGNYWNNVVNSAARNVYGQLYSTAGGLSGTGANAIGGLSQAGIGATSNLTAEQGRINAGLAQAAAGIQSGAYPEAQRGQLSIVNSSGRNIYGAAATDLARSPLDRVIESQNFYPNLINASSPNVYAGLQQTAASGPAAATGALFEGLTGPVLRRQQSTGMNRLLDQLRR